MEVQYFSLFVKVLNNNMLSPFILKRWTKLFALLFKKSWKLTEQIKRQFSWKHFFSRYITLHVTYRYLCELLWERNSSPLFAIWHIIYLILMFPLAVAKSFPSVWRTVCQYKNSTCMFSYAPITKWKKLFRKELLACDCWKWKKGTSSPVTVAKQLWILIYF